jgi:predicted nucleic acid-binding protein
MALPEALAAHEKLVMVDTSVWIQALIPAGLEACKTITSALVATQRAATCEIVIAEILRGARDGDEARRLEQRLRDLEVLSMGGVGTVAAEIGRTTAVERRLFADLLIAATASVHDAVLLHRDRDLTRICGAAGIGQVEL